MIYTLRKADPSDYDQIYHMKKESVRPYVEEIWGWNEEFQKKEFEEDFSHMEQFSSGTGGSRQRHWY